MHTLLRMGPLALFSRRSLHQIHYLPLNLRITSFLPIRRLTSAQNSEAYFAANKFTVSDIEKVLSDDAILVDVIQNIRRRKIADSSVHALFLGAIDMALGEMGAQAYSFLVQIWRLVFLQLGDLSSHLRTLLYASHEKLVNLMMNRGDFATFHDLFVLQVRLLRLLHESLVLGPFPSWAYTVMNTLQLTAGPERFSHNHTSVLAFLKNPGFSAEQKHRLNAILLRKSLLYSTIGREDIHNFVQYVTEIDHDSLFSFLGHHLVYKKALRLLLAQSDLHDLQNTVSEILSEDSYSHLVTAMMTASCTSQPNLTVQAFSFKQLQNTLTSKDLTSLMKAYIALNDHVLAIRRHSEFPLLQEDEQIVLLLEVSERTKNWKLLQQQFEDMYGKRDLPQVIHYSVVIGALASIGSQSEVERLYVQLQKRQLVPSYPIFRGIIRACINNHDYERAEVYHAEFLNRVQNGEIKARYIPRIEKEMLQIKLFLANTKVAMQAIEDLYQQQKLRNETYLDADIIVQMIKLFSATFSKQDFLRVWKFAEDAEILDERIFYQGALFYTKMGDFQKCHDLATLAQQKSIVPFQSNLIFKCQIKNFREWIRQVTDKRFQTILKERLQHLVTSLDKGITRKTISPRNLDVVLVELIKHFTANQRQQTESLEEDADRYFRYCKELGLLSEEVYLPFLQKYTGKNSSFQDTSRILDLYREMVALKIEISARSYKYLISALLKMDSLNKNGFKNSRILLESIFEIYGFNVGTKNFMASSEGIRSKKLSDVELLKNAVPLLEIMSEYSITTSGSIDLIVKVLDQFRERLAEKMSFEFRLSILKEMSKVYLSYGDLKVTASLLNNALDAVNDIVDQLYCDPVEIGASDLQNLVQLPKLLQMEFRQIYSVQLRMLERKFQNRPFEIQEYGRILENCVRRNIKLSGDQFNDIIFKLMQAEEVPSETFEYVLNCCERFLVSGNWAEVMIFKKISHIYRVFLRFLHQYRSAESIFQTYEILNYFYGIRTITQLQDILGEFKAGNPRAYLEREIKQFNRMKLEPLWTMTRFFNNIPEFFTPERQIRTRNFVRPGLAAQLVLYIEARSHGEYTFAFHLYDRYPETIEYLLYFNLEHPQIVRFRKDIERISGVSASVAGEGRFSRRKNSVRALSDLGRELRGRH